MGPIGIRRGTRADSAQFLGLVKELARFEKLPPPTGAGIARLKKAVFEDRRISLFVAHDGVTLVGYALYFYTYSSFLAKPTLYLEDLFVLDGYRKRGVGFSLFRRCVDEAISEGCGRMEWAVLAWNQKAIDFYERLGARRLSEWHVYRLDEEGLRRVPDSPLG